MMTDTPQTIHLHEYQPPAFLVERVELEFDLQPHDTTVLARATFRRNPDHGADNGADNADLRLDGEDMELVSLSLDGTVLAAADYDLDAAGLSLTDLPDAFELSVVTRIAPAANTKLEGLYQSSGIFCTQCEAQGFRRITYFPDRPDVMTTYRVTMRAEKAVCPILLCNGNLLDAGDLPDGRHFAVWDDPFPKPSYLFALVAGDLRWLEDHFTTQSGRNVQLRIYTDPGNEDRCAYAMDALIRSMRWDEEKYGLEYDLDLFNIVAINDFNMGAMENKSLNVFNAKYVLANPQTATDDDYANIEAIVAHEYFHNWTGNRVTCRDWFQLSLKEGLTVFRDQQFSADMRSAPVQRIKDVRTLRAAQFAEDAGPLAHPVRPASYIEINNFYTATVYEKGAEVIGMYQTLLGEGGFRKGMDLYFQRHDGQAVTCDDFLAAMADANGADLEQFKLWYSQAGTPEVHVSGAYDADAQVYELSLSQNLPATPDGVAKQPMRIPVAVGLLDGAGRDLPLDGQGATTKVVELTDSDTVVRFEGVTAAPVPSINRGFSAPIRVQQELDDTGPGFLMAHDSDPFNRWEAGQQYATALLGEMAAVIAAGGELSLDQGFIAALGHTLADEELDPAFVALACQLPSEHFLAEQAETADPTSIHLAREQMRQAIALTLRDQLLSVYDGNRSNAPFSPDAASAGRRALKNLALSYLSTLDDERCRSLAGRQFRDADNMTDRMAALFALNDRDGDEPDGEERAEALAAFHDEFKGDAVVIDKWLSLQAASSRPDTLPRVIELMAHPVFSITQPNKVRALISAFCAANPYRFHAPDGSGYRFLADRVLQLDPINPQIAARMATQLGRWRRYDDDRAALMRAELSRILATDGLSPDVFEIASKSLGETS
ncbi:MAG: aminopeptidase N [Rhodospirillaceae bacterium]|jgi:aminopeptidase N|nr:aminopeptidase N [Rhodospirillaceae bacterium]MBT5897424.1 aminopeptidase N [Rhodospirillaceae bacterium]MBT6428347.1 aminopeptidase N [Rhodospirillaceae bacterium]